MGRRFAAFLVLILAAPARVDAQRAPNIPLRAPDSQLDVGMTAIVSVRELRDGRLLVSDRVENRLALVDWRTGEVATIGGRGQGPGEYRDSGWLFALRGDTTLFTEPTRRWHTLDGPRIVRSLPMSYPLSRVFDPILFGSDSAGRVLSVDGFRWGESVALAIGKYQADSLVVMVAVTAGDADAALVVDTIARIAGPGEQACSPFGRGVRRGGAGGGAARTAPPCNPIATAEQPLLFPDGWLAVARTRPYRVDWRDPNGRWIRGAPIPGEPVPMSERDRCAALQGFPFERPGDCDRQQLEAPSWPQELPPFVAVGRSNSAPRTPALFAAPDGRLLIRRTPSSAAPGTRYDLVDRRGALDGVITLPPNEAIVGFGARAVYTIRTDDVDLQWLRRRPWP